MVMGRELMVGGLGLKGSHCPDMHKKLGFVKFYSNKLRSLTETKTDKTRGKYSTTKTGMTRV